MSTTYFLTILLALAVLVAAATARNNGAALDEPRQATKASHFHSHNWGKMRGHQSKSIKKTLEKAHDDTVTWRAKTKDSRARRTLEKELQIVADQDRTTSSRISRAKITNNYNNLKNYVREIPESQGGYHVQDFNKNPTTMEKSEEAIKHEPAASYRAKTTDHIHH